MFNPLDVLQNQGSVELTKQLYLKTDSELRSIVKFQAWARGKALKDSNRLRLIVLILEGSEAKLKQGLTLALIKKDKCSQ